MTEFYHFPQWSLTALVMAVAVCIMLQTLAASYSIRRLTAGWARRMENGMECAVLAVLFLFAALLAQVQYGLYGGFLMPGGYSLVRQAVFLLGSSAGCRRRRGNRADLAVFRDRRGGGPASPDGRGHRDCLSPSFF